MKIKTKDFRNAARTILYAIDSKEKNLFSETLELKTNGTYLYLNVTNRAYYVTVKFDLGYEDHLHATVNAQLFLSLISKVTTEEIEITASNRVLSVKANGEYKLPMIYQGDTLLELPVIEIGNQTNSMTVNSDILTSIALYNSKELIRGIAVKPVQNYYYVDEHGAITFTSGACVNNFTLDQPVKLLLDNKVVRLFKLFLQDEPVTMTLGQDLASETLIQTKVKFSTPLVDITAILPDSSLLSTVPVTMIRDMAIAFYNYSIVVEKGALLGAINRLLLFNNTTTYGFFEFNDGQLTIYDYSKENKEVVTLVSNTEGLSYSLITDLANFGLILEGSDDDYITITFGDHKAIVVKKNQIINIIPEIKA